MSRVLVIPSDLWGRLRTHLLVDTREHLAFLLARPSGQRLLVRDLITVPDEALEQGSGCDGLSLTLPALLDVMNTANRRQLVLVEAHNHPCSGRRVAFSDIDLRGQYEMVDYLSDVAPGRPYGALVLGANAIYGDVWLAGQRDPEQLDEIRVVGPTIERWPGDGTAVSGSPAAQEERYYRQILAFGAQGQQSLQRTRVAVVGTGGVGSFVAQELAHLGVGQFVLVDDDVVEVSNLHRLVGGGTSAIGRAKVEVAEHVIRKANPHATIRTIRASIRMEEALSAVADVDVVFGCVDTDHGRLILNELALAYLIPYIDCGVGITVEAGRISEAGGRVVVWVPGRPCLLCCREFHPRIAAEELESPEERTFRREHGYITGASVPEPAVISLNGTVASLAVTEFLALVTGWRPSMPYTYYDMLEQRAGTRVTKHDSRCTACALEGMGDGAALWRYTRTELPRDLPRLD